MPKMLILEIYFGHINDYGYIKKSEFYELMKAQMKYSRKKWPVAKEMHS